MPNTMRADFLRRIVDVLGSVLGRKQKNGGEGGIRPLVGCGKIAVGSRWWATETNDLILLDSAPAPGLAILKG